MGEPTRPRLHFSLLLVPVLALTVSCGGASMPSIEEQKVNIMNRDIRLDLVSRQAFEETWGTAPYENKQWTQFYPIDDGSLVPQFRVPLGEAPPQWLNAVTSEVGHFLQRAAAVGSVRTT